MHKHSWSETSSRAKKPRPFLDTTRFPSQQKSSEGEVLTLCVACLSAGVARPATGHTSHPQYRRLALCTDCIATYDRAVVE